MRKAEILVAAEQLFQHYGFAKTTVADIAREAGIGVGTVYLEFRSKEAIASSLTRRCRESVLEEMQDVVAAGGGFSERLIQLLEARQRGLHGFIERGLHGHDVVFAACDATRAINEDYARAEVALLIGFLEAGNEANAFGVADVPTTARIILKTYEAVIPAARKRDARAREELATLHALILGGVLSRV